MELRGRDCNLVFKSGLFGGLMKKLVFGVDLLLLVGLFLSCTTIVMSPPTTTDPYRPLNSLPNANVVGPIQAVFESALRLGGSVQIYPKAADLWRSNFNQVSEAAYTALLESAKKEHRGNIDIVDISWVYITRDGGMSQYSANGRVVLLGSSSTATGVEGAVERAAQNVSENFTYGARIAIVQITTQDRSTREFITGELEYILQRQGFYIVDRAELDRIWTEQNFGMSTDVDDITAALAGHIAGASIVITGRIDGEGSLRRLRLRALNTETAQVIGTASEPL